MTHGFKRRYDVNIVKREGIDAGHFKRVIQVHNFATRRREMNGMEWTVDDGLALSRVLVSILCTSLEGGHFAAASQFMTMNMQALKSRLRGLKRCAALSPPPFASSRQRSVTSRRFQCRRSLPAMFHIQSRTRARARSRCPYSCYLRLRTSIEHTHVEARARDWREVLREV